MHVRIKEVEKGVPNITYKDVPLKKSEEYLIEDVRQINNTDGKIIFLCGNFGAETREIDISDIDEIQFIRDEKEKAVDAIKNSDEAYSILEYLSKETFKLMNEYFEKIHSPYFELFWHDIGEVYDNLRGIKNNE